MCVHSLDTAVVDSRPDGIALDIEWTNDVPDLVARDRALIDLARRARQLVADELLDEPIDGIRLEGSIPIRAGERQAGAGRPPRSARHGACDRRPRRAP